MWTSVEMHMSHLWILFYCHWTRILAGVVELAY